MNTINITADIRKRSTMFTPNVVQNDTSATFIVLIQDNGVDVPLENTATYTLTSYQQDGASFMDVGEKTGDSQITFNLGTSALSKVGFVRASVQIFHDEGRVSTLEFAYNVVEDLSTGYKPSETDKSLIEVVFSEVRQAIDDLDTDLSNYATKEELPSPEQVAEWDSKETVEGSQSKADKALEDANTYTDQQIEGLDVGGGSGGVDEQLVDEKIEEHAERDDVHGLRSNTVEIGVEADASGTNSIAVGREADASGYNAIAIGGGFTRARGSDSIAIGHSANVRNFGGMALGYSASTNGSNSTAVGKFATALNDDQGVLGTDSDTSDWLVPGSFTVEGTKNFEMPHPHPDKQATHRLRHSAVESPTAGDNLYRYIIHATEDNQTVEYHLPDYFMYLNKDVDVWINGIDHFGNAYGSVIGNTLHVTCQFAGEYNVLVIGTRNDNHQSVQDWDIMGVEREIGESWRGETYAFEVKEIIDVEEIKEVTNNDND